MKEIFDEVSAERPTLAFYFEKMFICMSKHEGTQLDTVTEYFADFQACDDTFFKGYGHVEPVMRTMIDADMDENARIMRFLWLFDPTKRSISQ